MRSIRSSKRSRRGFDAVETFVDLVEACVDIFFGREFFVGMCACDHADILHDEAFLNCDCDDLK